MRRRKKRSWLECGVGGAERKEETSPSLVVDWIGGCWLGRRGFEWVDGGRGSRVGGLAEAGVEEGS